MGHGHENKAQSSAGDHDGEALSATPHVQHLGHGDVTRGGHAVCDDGDDGGERVHPPFAGDEGRQGGENRETESIDQEKKPDAVESRS